MEELDLSEIEEALEPSFSGMQDMLNEIYISDAIPLLIAEVKRLRQDRAEVRRDALLEAAKAVCNRCSDGYDVKVYRKGYYEHTYYNTECEEDVDVYCDAAEIHKLLAADQGQGQGKD